jgi:endonuclease/exonuclease/phosphatase family metal-dependent hydrolase
MQICIIHICYLERERVNQFTQLHNISLENICLNAKKKKKKNTFYFLIDVVQKEKNPLPHIIVGDFNALQKSDYSKKQWEEIAKVKVKNKWEKPQDLLIKHITKDLNCIITHRVIFFTGIKFDVKRY